MTTTNPERAHRRPRLQVPMAAETRAEIDELARASRVSPTAMASILLTEAVIRTKQGGAL